jgi:hypothetical protein
MLNIDGTERIDLLPLPTLAFMPEHADAKVYHARNASPIATYSDVNSSYFLIKDVPGS